MSNKLLHLQGMRGVAICEVVLFHYFPDYFPNGYLGVDLFFVLSGYLMSMMLARHESLSVEIVGEFLYKRLKRIAPLYYFVILVTLGSLYFLPFSNITPNLEASMKALLLQKNIIQSGDMDYFDKLGQAKDMFTHTWSLCLEMQFYLLFPLIWFLQCKFEDFSRMAFLYVVCAGSLLVYSISGPFVAFNNVFARIWQFLLGNVVFILQQENEHLNREEKYVLLDQNDCRDGKEEAEVTKGMSAEWVTTSFALSLLLFSAVSEDHLTQNYARFATTVVSSILILFGKSFGLLEWQAMTFLGEISYSWYLVHWPMVSAQKLLGYDGLIEMGVGLTVSFLLATTVHYLVEKQYLSWNKVAVFAAVGITICCSVVVHVALNSYVENLPFTLPKSHKNMTKEEVIAYNVMLNNMDQIQLKMKHCIYNPDHNTWYGHCQFEDTNPAANLSIMITGNSWSANSAPLVYEECKSKASKMTVAALPGCEILHQTKRYDHCDAEEPIVNVEKEKPDVLFIIASSVEFHLPKNKAEATEFSAEALRRLKRLETSVSKKIFILNIQPINARSYIDDLLATIRNGTELEYNSQFIDKEEREKGRIAFEKVISQCSKCEMYDYSSSFTFDGKFYLFHPVTKITFFTKGSHLTLEGLEKARHVYTDICAKL